MSQNSKIEWTDHTFNPWVGCTKISPACDNCYAESWAKRSGLVTWGGPLRRTSPANWREPVKWHRLAAKAGIRQRVFCASLADVFDNQAPEEWRNALFALIADTPSLDWLLLTKRPQNIAKLMPPRLAGDGVRPNVWLGTTVENRDELRRVDHLRALPARVRFLSCEPLLQDLGEVDLSGISWVIAGGESGPNARPSHPDWFRSLRDQCAAAGVAFHFKQHGEFIGVPDLRRLPGGTGPGFGRYDHCHYDREHEAVRVGKKVAGRLLDGVEHNGFPEVRP